MKVLARVAAILLVTQDYAFAGWLIGTVTNEDTGAPVAGVLVESIYEDGEVKSDTTNAAGLYEIQVNKVGNYRIRANMTVLDPLADQYYGGGVKKSTASLVNLAKESDTVTDLDIALKPGYPILGTVTAAGVALPDIDMDVYAEDGEFLGTYNTVTAANGFYEIGPLPNGNYLVRADPNALLGQTQILAYYGIDNPTDPALATPVNVFGKFTPGIDFDLDEGGIIRGTITDSGAKLLADIDLDIYDTDGNLLPYNGMSGADGVYAIGPLPTGNYILKADPSLSSRYVDAYYPNVPSFDDAEKISVEVGTDVANVDFSLILGGIMTGIISDAVTLDPLPNVDLDVYDADGNSVRVTARSRTDGRFDIGAVVPGNYILKADPEAGTGYIVQYFDNTLSRNSATAIEVKANGVSSGLNFNLEQGGLISGTVFGPGEVPLPNIDIDIFTDSGARLDANVATGIDGTFSIGPVPDGDYLVRADPSVALGQYYVEAFFGGTADQDSASVITVSGGSANGIDFNLQTGGAISGAVQGNGGVPLEDIDIDIFSDEGDPLPYNASSGAGGGYVIGPLPPGDYLLKVDPPDGGTYIGLYYNAVLSRSEASSITVSENLTTMGIDFDLFTGGSIEGLVTDDEGTPLDGVDMDVFNASGARLDVSSATVDGVYSLGPLPDGNYYVRADPDPLSGAFQIEAFYGDALDLENASVVNISGGTTSGVDIQLTSGGIISGVVKNTDEEPLEGIDLDLFDIDGSRLNYSATSQEDGTYAIGPLPAGTYLLKSDPEDESGYTGLYYNNAVAKRSATGIYVAVGVESSNIDFALFQGGWISGRIRSTSGTALPGVDLDVYNEAGNRMDATALSEPDGTYLLGPLPPGDYFVRADPDDTTGFMPTFYPDAFGRSESTPVTVVAADIVLDIDFGLAVAGWIEGLITDELGNPLPDIDLDAFDAVSKERLTQGGETGADGRYIIGPLPVGDIIVRADPTIEQGLVREYYSEAIALRIANPIAVTGGSGTPDINFTLEPGSYIGGTVTDPDDRNPVAGVDIDVFRASDMFKMDQNAKTRADGSYSIGPLPEGSYIVKFDARSSTAYLDIFYDGTEDVSSATSIELTADADVVGIDSNLPVFTLFPEIVPSDGPDSQGLTFRWQSQIGKEYLIEYSDDLAVDSWITLITLEGDGLIKSYEVDIPNGITRRFFRIRIKSS